MSKLIATVFYVGYLRPAPGTWGSLAALPLAYGLHLLGGPVLLGLAVLVVAAIGTWAIARETAGQSDHDPSEIVIDEVAGQWIALWPVSLGAYMTGFDVLALWPGLVCAFLFFRLFDISKPWLVGRADRKGTPWGVMEDDLWAGAFAALLTVVFAVLAHVVFI